MLSPPFTIVMAATCRTPAAYRLSFFLALPQAQQSHYSNGDRRYAKQAHMRSGEIRESGGRSRQADRDDGCHPKDLARDNVARREASVGEVTNEKQQIVDIRRREDSDRQQGERENAHEASGFSRRPRGPRFSYDPSGRARPHRGDEPLERPTHGGAASPGGGRLRR